MWTTVQRNKLSTSSNLQRATIISQIHLSMESRLLLVIPLLLLTIITATSATVKPHSNITLNSFLIATTASARSLSWLSPSGDFALGFLPLPTNSSLFLLAIWYANLPNTTTITIIWTPNRNKPVPSNSSIILTSDGQLSLRDPAGTEIWNSGARAASYAALFDTGNFVLVASNGSILWESFSVPTDTILPSQSLSPNSILLAKLNYDDFSYGRFKLSMQTDGNLVFYQIAVPTGFQYSPYWASNTNTSNSFLFFNVSGSIDLVSPTGAFMTTLTSSTTCPTSDFYHRGTLDHDGVFRHYVHPKPSAAGGAAAEWVVIDFKPTDICQSLITSLGSGACGHNSYCGYDMKQMVACQCPLGYSWVDPKKTYMGCKPDFTMPGCISGVWSEGFQMVRVENLDFWGEDYDQFNPMGEAECMQECLDDCFCAASIHDGISNCWKKKLPFSNGRIGSYVDRIAFIKVGVNKDI
ncbi:hypothetical protein M5K25_013400 [Dendrobium thyrsiflorum]|uniref:Bulb-type lectin domain-containing protein n=1 Tax=Dendrobium thyrsiflorum TaxID=117978 RepID=A0ABD0USY7_DENTH